MVPPNTQWLVPKEWVSSDSLLSTATEVPTHKGFSALTKQRKEAEFLRRCPISARLVDDIVKKKLNNNGSVVSLLQGHL
jgi:hypothetical protein